MEDKDKPMNKVNKDMLKMQSEYSEKPQTPIDVGIEEDH